MTTYSVHLNNLLNPLNKENKTLHFGIDVYNAEICKVIKSVIPGF